MADNYDLIQIHELTEFSGDLGEDDVMPIDDGQTTRKIKVPNLLAGVTQKGNSIWYGTSASSASTTSKVVACEDFELEVGTSIAVKFTYTNTVASPSLNVNDTGAVAIKTVSGGSESLYGLWSAGEVQIFTYDGTNWLADTSSRAGVIAVSKSSVSSLATTITDANITSKHVVLDCTLSNPAAQTSDWSVTTSNGSLTISGSISGTTDIKLILGYQTN